MISSDVISLAPDKIVAAVPIGILCDVVMEECAELAVAVSKIKRALTPGNPTGWTSREARQLAQEEYNDLRLAVDVLNQGLVQHGLCCLYLNEAMYHAKLTRWAERLREAECQDKSSVRPPDPDHDNAAEVNADDA